MDERRTMTQTKKTQHFEPAAERVIREPERKHITGCSRSDWYRKEKAGLAPQRVPLGDNSHGWMLSEILAWIEARKVARSTRHNARSKSNNPSVTP